MSEKSQEVWKHNSFLGHARMMEQNCRSIMESKTATVETKIIATEIYHKATQLTESLKTRRPGT